jgi:hypothetical protein
MPVAKANLKIDWASHEAAKYACEHWHYSKSLPPSPMVHIGVWEGKIFKGVVLFSRGSCQNLLKPFNLKPTEGCELVRIALSDHENTVSRIIKISLKLLKSRCKGLRLIVSFADPDQCHHGGIYQAGGWIYTGRSQNYFKYKDHSGRLWHPRMVSSSGYKKCYGVSRKVVKISETMEIETSGKLRYLMPLDDEMRQQILPLAKPYPKRINRQELGTPPSLGGSTPTGALQLSEVEP